MSGSFLRYLLRRQPLNAARTAVVAHYRYRFTGKGRAARWPICYCGAVLYHSETRFAGASGGFVRWFLR